MPESATVAPCACSERAIAPPIAPLAPVTSAALLDKSNIISSSPPDGSNVRWTSDRGNGRAFRKASDQSAKHLSGTNLIEIRHTGARHVHHYLRQRTVPVTCAMSDRTISAGSSIAFASTFTNGPTWHRRRLDGYFGQRFRHYIGCRLHQRAMKGSRYRQQHCTFCAFRLGDFHRTLDRRFIARDNYLTGTVIVGSLAHLALRGFRCNR